MQKFRFQRAGAFLLTAALLFSQDALAVSAKAKTAPVPPGVTLTKTGLVTDQKTLSQAMKQAASGGSSSSSKTSKVDETVLRSLTVLDADDLYYTRTEGQLPLVVTADSGAVRFHNVKVGDPRSIVEGKLGEAFTLAASSEKAGGVDFYQDAENTAYLLWIQYDANDNVQSLVFQRDPAQP
ncbi:MAG: hypothetical protein ACI4OJ_08750 [Lachnospiraceae bacterium]